MKYKKIKKRTRTDESPDSSTSQSIDEEDVLKIIKTYKIDPNDNKQHHSVLIKSFLINLNQILDNLIKKNELESYDIFGGYRYGYLTVNDINIDLLLKIHNKNNFNKILNHFKDNLDQLNSINSADSTKHTVNLLLLTNNTHNNNLLNKTLVINVKRAKKEFNYKLFFTIVKFDKKRNTRKVNINEYLISKLDEIHNKYSNISNALVLIKLFLHSYNVDKIKLNITPDSASTNLGLGHDKHEMCKFFCSSGLNGYVFNLLLTHLCTINNYSENVKSIILFKNVLTFLINTVSKSGIGRLVYCEHSANPNKPTDDKTSKSLNLNTNKGPNGDNAENDDESNNTIHSVLNDEIKDKLATLGLYNKYLEAVDEALNNKISLYTEKYVEVDLFQHIELTFPQLIYYSKVALNVLNDSSLKSDKIRKLFLQRNYLSNFYEHCLYFKDDSHKEPETIDRMMKELLYLLRYVFKERLYLVHLYFINHYDSAVKTDSLANLDYNDYINSGVMIYFTFNHNVQGVLDYGPTYTANSRSGTESNYENKMYELVWADNYQLVKTNNIIQYTVNLLKITTDTADKHSKPSKLDSEQLLLLDGLNSNVNYSMLIYVLNRLLNTRLINSLSVNINNVSVKFPFITNYHKDLISVTNDFTDILTSLQYLPLKILNIQIINEAYSYLNVYTPPAVQSSYYRELIKIVIKWEHSNKWPNEEQAYNNVVISLLLLVSKELKHKYKLNSQLRGDNLFVDYGNYTYQLINYRHLRFNKIASSPTQIANSTTSSGPATDANNNLEKDYLLSEQCRNEVMKNVSFINCVRLLKIFSTKYVKLDLNQLCKTLPLNVYNNNNNSIKSESSVIQFLQILYHLIHLSSINSTNTATNTPNDNVNIATTTSGTTVNYDPIAPNLHNHLSKDSLKRLIKYSRMLLKHINSNLQSVPLNIGSTTGGCNITTNLNEKGLNTLFSNNWNYNMMVRLHNPKVYSPKSTIAYTKQHMICLVKYIKMYLEEIADIYYYKYELLGYFNTKSYKHLNIYFKFNKFNFVPRLNFKPRRYAQSIITPDTHFTLINKLHRSHTSANSLIDANEFIKPEHVSDNLIVVPNVILILRLLTNLAHEILYNIVLTYTYTLLYTYTTVDYIIRNLITTEPI